MMKNSEWNVMRGFDELDGILLNISCAMRLLDAAAEMLMERENQDPVQGLAGLVENALESARAKLDDMRGAYMEATGAKTA